MTQHPDTDNELFHLAADLVNHTGRHIFLTGKAGTGKTTFLKYIRENCTKKMVVAAPTGVAAINAGGTTLHALFQLPFGLFIPQRPSNMAEMNAYHPEELIQKIRLSGPKKELLRSIELLIIDEVSMMRSDLLDAIDTLLRHVRQDTAAFGGVQVLFIGDLFQLPPVVQNEEWSVLRNYYASPFFFHAKVLQNAALLPLELKKIYRQNEQSFIDILNRIRMNQVLQKDLDTLNERFSNKIPEEKQLITLTSHNQKADTLNLEGLERLNTPSFKFEASIKGDYNENALPTEKILTLKEGAQIMFIKNDSGELRRFYNGKLATITSIDDEDIYVRPVDETEDLKLEKETWKNIRYVLNKQTNSIEEDELGSFTQYPIRLAWAITIHKSQGLTFSKAVIDAGQSFSAGQVYVALSRCTTLEGITLLSKIHAGAIRTDPTILAFSENELPTHTLATILEEEKISYRKQQLLTLFNWNPITQVVKELLPLLNDPELEDPLYPQSLFRDLIAKVEYQTSISEKLKSQIQYCWNNTDDITQRSLKEKLSNGVPWFLNSILNDLHEPLKKYIRSLDKKLTTKNVLQKLQHTLSVFKERIHLLQSADFPEWGIERVALDAKVQTELEQDTLKKSKKEKGASQKESLRLFKEGASIESISKERNLAPTTIFQHLATFVRMGELNATDLISEEKLNELLPRIQTMEKTDSLTAMKEALNNKYSFEEIRVTLNHIEFLTSKQNM